MGMPSSDPAHDPWHPECRLAHALLVVLEGVHTRSGLPAGSSWNVRLGAACGFAAEVRVAVATRSDDCFTETPPWAPDGWWPAGFTGPGIFDAISQGPLVASYPSYDRLADSATRLKRLGAELRPEVIRALGLIHELRLVPTDAILAVPYLTDCGCRVLLTVEVARASACCVPKRRGS